MPSHGHLMSQYWPLTLSRHPVMPAYHPLIHPRHFLKYTSHMNAFLSPFSISPSHFNSSSWPLSALSPKFKVVAFCKPLCHLSAHLRHPSTPPHCPLTPLHQNLTHFRCPLMHLWEDCQCRTLVPPLNSGANAAPPSVLVLI